MDSTTLALVALRYLQINKKKKVQNRRWWVHPVLSNRLVKGQFISTYNELRTNEDEFFGYTRMSMSTFDELYNLLEIHLTKQTTGMRIPIGPKERLCIALRYLATGCSFSELRINFKVGASTAHNIVIETCKIIWKNMKASCMPELTRQDWIGISKVYQTKSNFPNCLGAIDGKHIRIRKPQNTGSEYFNYKNYFSIVLMAVVDANYKFIVVDIGAYGKGSDSQIFQDSNFGQKLLRDELDLPLHSTLEGYNSEHAFPYVFIADEAFPLNERIMRPYGGHNLTVNQRIYNYRLSRARRFVECAFGILANKWQLFHTPITLEPENVTHVVKAACILHNFVRERDGVNFDDAISYQDLNDVEFSNNSQKSAKTVRDNFATYFASPEGEIPWQMTKI